MRRSRPLAVLTALALAASGILVAAAPAQAQTATWANPLATPETTDLDITSFTVSNDAEAITVVVETQNLPATGFSAGVFLFPYGGTIGSGATAYYVGAEVLAEGTQTGAFVTRGGDITLEAARGVAFSHTETGFQFVIPRSTYGWSGFVDAYAAVDDGSTSRVIAAGGGPDYLPFGPLRQEGITATKTKLKISAKAGERAEAIITVKRQSAGVVYVYDDDSYVGKAKVRRGKAIVKLPKKLKSGTHVIVAVFTPKSLQAAESSDTARLTVKKKK